MGINAIRLYADVPAQWVRYIYEQYGIYTMVNTTFGRYGLTINGAWVGNTDYSDPKVQKALLAEARNMVKKVQRYSRGTSLPFKETKTTMAYSGKERKQKTSLLKTGNRPNRLFICTGFSMRQQLK